ncbi:unnamed protein product [Adineta steineri]|uniref:Hydrophobin n=1 Tax=Adineta steineri TaxID=433720 RepID=A0A819NDA1_9BILA|nr:unnamed protein product [Adineta steineri]CAF3995185.1 unnamed protein product [Adineta steineri]CAF3995226.1 unnamed protein product [Adineta steineri]
MQISKCLCLVIITVIVIATNASPARKRRSGKSGCSNSNGQGNSNGNPNTNNGNGENYTLQPGQYTYTNKQSTITNTVNKCNSGATHCCNNGGSSKGDRRKRNSGSSFGNLFGSGTNSEQTSCDNVATSGTSGTQYTGCDSTQDCCQGNTVNGLVSLQCSSASLPSN